MTTIKSFKSTHLLKINKINLDYWTETYSISFYQDYLIRNPKLCLSISHPDDSLMGYLFGKIEGRNKELHGHVTALSISPLYRKIGLASLLMKKCEELSNNLDKCYFVDLFVRLTNSNAIKMYTKLGYSVFRRVVGYYGDKEDAYDMRKCLDIDKEGISIRENGHLVRCAPEDTIFN